MLNIENFIQRTVEQAVEETRNENLTVENVFQHIDFNYVDNVVTGYIKQYLEKKYDIK